MHAYKVAWWAGIKVSLQVEIDLGIFFIFSLFSLEVIYIISSIEL